MLGTPICINTELWDLGVVKENTRAFSLGAYMGCVCLLLISPEDRICAPSHRGPGCAAREKKPTIQVAWAPAPALQP